MYLEYSQTRQQLSCHFYGYLTGVRYDRNPLLCMKQRDLIVSKLKKRHQTVEKERVHRNSRQIKKSLYRNINSKIIGEAHIYKTAVLGVHDFYRLGQKELK